MAKHINNKQLATLLPVDCWLDVEDIMLCTKMRRDSARQRCNLLVGKYLQKKKIGGKGFYLLTKRMKVLMILGKDKRVGRWYKGNRKSRVSSDEGQEICSQYEVLKQVGFI